MSPVVVGLLGFVALFVLLAFRVQLGLALILVSAVGNAIIVGPGAALIRLGSDPVQTATTFELSVIPAFVLMGYLLAKSGLANALFRAISRLMPQLRGGLAVATIGVGGALASVVGSGLASTATLSSIAVPEMRRYGYAPGFSAATAAAGGTLGLLIPPSALLILYGILTEESIGRVLIAGILPGILTMGLLMFVAFLVAVRRPDLAPLPTVVDRIKGPDRQAMAALFAVALVFAVSIGGIYLGWFTPTEAGGVGAGLALLLAVTLGDLGRGGLIEALSETARLTALVFIIIIGGRMLGFFLAVTGIPMRLTDFIEARDLAPLVVIGIIFVVYFVMGAIMDELAILVIMTPIAYPIVTGLGFDGIWFGILTMMMLLTGLLTPPIGLLVFVVSGITKTDLGAVFRAVTPYWVGLIIAILIVMFVPEVALVLPNLMR